MLSILSGITGLWSAPVTKYVVVATLAGSAWLYTYNLNNTIENQQLVIMSKNQQLISKGVEVAQLTLSVEQANNEIKLALLEIESRELLASQRLAMLNDLRSQLTQFEHDLTVLEHTNEQVKDWANEPIPDVVIGLLINARDKNSNIDSGAEGEATTTINTALSYSRDAVSYQPRLNQTHWKTLSINKRVQF
jgi:hypothetical protein